MNQSPLDHQAVKNIKNYQPQNRNDAVKNEYLDGRVAPKHAANRWHNLIASNFAIAIGSRMNRSTCELYTNDMQVEMVLYAGARGFAQIHTEVVTVGPVQGFKRIHRPPGKIHHFGSLLSAKVLQPADVRVRRNHQVPGGVRE